MWAGFGGESFVMPYKTKCYHLLRRSHACIECFCKKSLISGTIVRRDADMWYVKQRAIYAQDASLYGNILFVSKIPQ